MNKSKLQILKSTPFALIIINYFVIDKIDSLSDEIKIFILLISTILSLIAVLIFFKEKRKASDYSGKNVILLVSGLVISTCIYLYYGLK